MDFPIFIKVGPLSIHPHLFFETLAYFIGFRVYLYTRNKGSIPFDKAMWIVIGAIAGAAVGSKVLYWFENPIKTLHHITSISYLMEGKTIVGGLLGGLIGVETAKKLIGWKRSTGDDFVIPLVVGMCIGRIGCFLTGLSDHTHGTPTDWVTGVDFGDGVLRHPTQLYELVYLLILGIVAVMMKKKGFIFWQGFLFQFFMLAYLLFRFFIEFIKPTPHPYLIFNNIQLAAIAGIVYYVFLIRKKRGERLRYAE